MRTVQVFKRSLKGWFSERKRRIMDLTGTGTAGIYPRVRDE